MPLAFPSRSHGTVAFGFFNIETDLLLLENLFFFADQFCRAIVDLSLEAGEPVVDGWRVEPRRRVGNLHGAIAGVDLSGFIGATYERWPFPRDEAAFRQNPVGSRNRAAVEAMIGDFGRPERLTFAGGFEAGVRIAEYEFDAQASASLIAYVDRGGMPKWRDDVRPDYVSEMMREIERLRSRG